MPPPAALLVAQVTAVGKEKPCGFWVLTNSRSLELCAESEEVAGRWIAVLQTTANQVPLSTKEPRAPPPQHHQHQPHQQQYQPPPPPQQQQQPPPPPAAPPPITHARALYDFTATRDDEMSLRAGEVVEVLSTADADWWLGHRAGATGYFPAIYTEPTDVWAASGGGAAAPGELHRDLSHNSSGQLISNSL